MCLLTLKHLPHRQYFLVMFTKTVSQRAKTSLLSLSISSRISSKPWSLSKGGNQLLLTGKLYKKKKKFHNAGHTKPIHQFNLAREWRTTEGFLQVYQQQKEDKGKCRSAAEWERTQKRPRYSPPTSTLSVLVRLTINNSTPPRSDGKSGARNTPHQ